MPRAAVVRCVCIVMCIARHVMGMACGDVAVMIVWYQACNRVGGR